MNRVEFLSQQTHDEVGRHLRSCRVAVVPSIIDPYGETEGTSVVVVEAMAAGSLGPRCGQNTRRYRTRAKWRLCREKDPDDLAEKIVLAHEDDGSDTVATASQTDRRFDWSRVVENYHKVFVHVLQRRQQAERRGRN